MIPYSFRIFRLLLVLVFFDATIALADEKGIRLECAQCGYQKSIFFNGTSSFEIVPIDSEVLLHAKPDLSDLRVVSLDSLKSEEEVPYQIVDESLFAPVVPIVGVTFETASTRKGEETLLVRLASEGLVHNRVTLESPSHPSQVQVRIYSSAVALAREDTRWKLLQDSGQIYQLSGQDGRIYHNGSVEYTETSDRFLKIELLSQEKKSINISRVSLDRIRHDSLLVGEVAILGRVTEWKESGVTEIAYNLGSLHLPTSGVTLSVRGGTHFLREVIVSESINGKTWQRIGSGAIAGIQQKENEATLASVLYPLTMARYIRVEIINADATPLQFDPRSVFETRNTLLVFQREPLMHYVLRYGKNKPEEDELHNLHQYFRLNDLAQFDRATLGDELIMQGSNPRDNAPVIASPRSWKVVFGVLFILVLSIGCYVLIRKMCKDVMCQWIRPSKKTQIDGGKDAT